MYIGNLIIAPIPYIAVEGLTSENVLIVDTSVTWECDGKFSVQ
jgi:hypothetical protein